AETAGVYIVPGWLAWVRGGSLVAQRLDLVQKVLTGDPVILADAVAADPRNVGAISSGAGLVAYRSGALSRQQLTWFDRTGKALGTLGALNDAGGLGFRISSDGQRVAVVRNVLSNTDVWLLDGIRSTRFTSDPAVDSLAIWSPDGSRVVFQS